jgi:uncharacterized protein YjiS (DUF1127 family)
LKPFARFHALQDRALRMNHYRKVRAELETLSEHDLADIGLKRYQLGSIARQRAFH